MNSNLNTGFIERYQIVLEKDPKSRVFAPLAEAYRKMGLLTEAKNLCEKGLEVHPQFSSGIVALARILMDLNNFEDAIIHLKKALDLSPENILAQNLYAKCLLELKKPLEALKAYKMLLFLTPQHEEAQAMVKKLEALEADEMEEEMFEMTSLPSINKTAEAASRNSDKNKQLKLERLISLADAFTIRNETDKAIDCLTNAQKEFGDHPELIQRLSMISDREVSIEIPRNKAVSKSQSKKINILHQALRRIELNKR